jgi:hypothetical protein
MPATTARISFIQKAQRIAIAGPDTSVATAYGDAARDVDPDDPIVTYFDSMADVAVFGQARLDLLKVERRRFQVEVNGASVGYDITYSSSTPTAQFISGELSADMPAAIVDISIDIDNDSAALVVWG